MKRDRERGKGVEKMQRGECGLLETASRVVVMQAVAGHTDAMLKAKTCPDSSYYIEKVCYNRKYETRVRIRSFDTFLTPHIVQLYVCL